MASEVLEWISRPMLVDIREKSECATVRIEGNGIRLIGTRKQVRGTGHEALRRRPGRAVGQGARGGGLLVAVPLLPVPGS